MRLPLLISLSLLLFAWQSARAQFLTADDFFNSGAQFYISNNIPLAQQRTEMGLQIYPKNEKLQKLEELLKQQQQQQNQQNQQQQQQKQNQSKQDQQKNQQSQSQQQQQSDQADAQKQKEEQARKAQEEKQKQDQEKKAEAAGQKKDDKSGEETNEVADASGAHPLTPQEAERLLNSQKGSEQYLSLKPKGKPPESRHPLKDW